MPGPASARAASGDPPYWLAHAHLPEPTSTSDAGSSSTFYVFILGIQ